MASGITKSTPKKYESRHLLLSDASIRVVGGIKIFPQPTDRCKPGSKTSRPDGCEQIPAKRDSDPREPTLCQASFLNHRHRVLCFWQTRASKKVSGVTSYRPCI